MSLPRARRLHRSHRVDHTVARALMAQTAGIATVHDLATRARLSRETIYGWLRAGRAGVGPDARADIAAALGEDLARAIERIAEARGS